MITKTYPVGTLPAYKYVVVLSEYQGKILLSRHKKRTTWETQGGKIEPGETPLMAAKRELYEESGAVDFEIEPLCDYWAGEVQTKEEGNGRVFLAKVKSCQPCRKVRWQRYAPLTNCRKTDLSGDHTDTV